LQEMEGNAENAIEGLGDAIYYLKPNDEQQAAIDQATA
jgi:hypothetical protein